MYRNEKQPNCGNFFELYLLLSAINKGQFIDVTPNYVKQIKIICGKKHCRLNVNNRKFMIPRIDSVRVLLFKKNKPVRNRCKIGKEMIWEDGKTKF